MLKTCKRCGSTERNTAGRCIQCQRRAKRDHMRRVRINDPAKYARWQSLREPYQLSAEQLARKYERRRQRGRSQEISRHAARMLTDPVYAAKIESRDRARQGLPMPMRPKPAHCEWPGCAKSAGLALDHCHDTGLFRGWLCRDHNLGLGRIGDNAAALRAGLGYLARAESEAWLAYPGNGLPLDRK